MLYKFGIHVANNTVAINEDEELAFAKRFLSLLSHVKELLPSQSKERYTDDIFQLWIKNVADTLRKYRDCLTTQREKDTFHSGQIL